MAMSSDAQRPRRSARRRSARLCRRYVLEKAAKAAKEKLGVSVEIIDLRTLLPWDTETVFNSVRFVRRYGAPDGRSCRPLVRRSSASAARASLRRLCGRA